MEQSGPDKPDIGTEEKKRTGKKKLFGYFVLAYVGAALILMLAVLPVEYGFDPFGIGKATGLDEKAAERETNPYSYETEATLGHAFIQNVPFKTETIRIPIEDLGEVEYKLIMEEGQTFVFNWRVEGATPNGGVYFDFHGHPGKETRDQYEEGFFLTYNKGEQPTLHGGFTAPFKGYHGFFFLNLEERPIEVVLEVSGYYNDHIELYRAIAGEVVTRVEY